MESLPVYTWGIQKPGSVARASLPLSIPPERYNVNQLKGRPKPQPTSSRPASDRMSSTVGGVPAAKVGFLSIAPADFYNMKQLNDNGKKPQPVATKPWDNIARQAALGANANTTPDKPPGKLTVQHVVDSMKLLAQSTLDSAEEKVLKSYAVELSILQAAERKNGLDNKQLEKLNEINSYVGNLLASRIQQQAALKDGMFKPKDKDIAKMNKLKKALSEIVLTVATTPADKAEQARLIGDVLRRIPPGGGDDGDDGGDGGDLPVVVDGDLGIDPLTGAPYKDIPAESLSDWLGEFKLMFDNGDKAGIETMARETLDELPLTKAEEKEIYGREEKYAEEDNEEEDQLQPSDIENENYDGRELPDVDFEPKVKPKFSMTPLRNVDFQFTKDKLRPVPQMELLRKDYSDALFDLSQKKKLTKEEKKDVKVLQEMMRQNYMSELPLAVERLESASSKAQKGRIVDVADQLMSQGMSSRGVDRLFRAQTEEEPLEQSELVKPKSAMRNRNMEDMSDIIEPAMKNRNMEDMSDIIEPEPVLSPLDLVEAAALGEYKFNDEDEKQAVFSDALVQLVKTKTPINQITVGALKNLFRELYGKTLTADDLWNVYEFAKELRPNKKVSTTFEMLKPIVGKKVYEELMTFAPVRGRPRKALEERKERPPPTEEQKKYIEAAMRRQLESRTPDYILGQGRKKLAKKLTKKLTPRKRK